MEKTKERYIEAVGRRKTAVARVRVFPATKNSILVNDKESNAYFTLANMQRTISEPLNEVSGKFRVTARIVGGGMNSQAEALRHGIARALVSGDETLRKTLKRAGYLKRDPRAKERRKFGLKKARKAPQWSKR